MSPNPEEPEPVRWSHPHPPVPLDDDEIELGRIVAKYLEEAYLRFFATALDLETERRVPWRGWLGEDIGLLPEPRRVSRQSLATYFDEPRAEPVRSLSALPVITWDEVRERYGTSGELEPRGFWMAIDVESDQGLPGETKL